MLKMQFFLLDSLIERLTNLTALEGSADFQAAYLSILRQLVALRDRCAAAQAAPQL